MISAASSASDNQQMFLQLLVAQVQHQDPLEPVDQQEFVGQLSQFSMVEGIEQLNTNFSELLRSQQLADGASVLGRVAEFETGDGLVGSGVIESTAIHEGRLMVTIDGQEVPFDQIQRLNF